MNWHFVHGDKRHERAVITADAARGDGVYPALGDTYRTDLRVSRIAARLHAPRVSARRSVPSLRVHMGPPVGASP
jgi:hypothetical protein